MPYRDVYNLPVRYRKWFVERLVKHFNDINSKNKQKDNEPLNLDAFNKFDDMVKQKFSK